eukprot:1104775-Prymnesium_polylepis.1
MAHCTFSGVNTATVPSDYFCASDRTLPSAVRASSRVCRLAFTSACWACDWCVPVCRLKMAPSPPKWARACWKMDGMVVTLFP